MAVVQFGFARLFCGCICFFPAVLLRGFFELVLWFSRLGIKIPAGGGVLVKNVLPTCGRRRMIGVCPLPVQDVETRGSDVLQNTLGIGRWGILPYRNRAHVAFFLAYLLYINNHSIIEALYIGDTLRVLAVV